MRFSERRIHPGTLALPCLALALAGCGGGGVPVGDGGAEEQVSERTDEIPPEPLVIAAARPEGAIDPATGNPFEIPDPDAPAPSEAPSEPAEAELPTHAPDGTPYCD